MENKKQYCAKLEKILSSTVLARISKMPVQNSNLKDFARPDLATYLHLIA